MTRADKPGVQPSQGIKSEIRPVDIGRQTSSISLYSAELHSIEKEKAKHRNQPVTQGFLRVSGGGLGNPRPTPKAFGAALPTEHLCLLTQEMRSEVRILLLSQFAFQGSRFG